MNFQATITVNIQQIYGPTITNPDHIAAWLTRTGFNFEPDADGFTFNVCAAHPNPDDCRSCRSHRYPFRITFDAVNTIQPANR